MNNEHVKTSRKKTLQQVIHGHNERADCYARRIRTTSEFEAAKSHSFSPRNECKFPCFVAAR